MKAVAADVEVTAIEYEGRAAGSVTTFRDAGGDWVWGWQRPDDIRLTGAGYKSSEAAAEDLMRAVRLHYGAMN